MKRKYGTRLIQYVTKDILVIGVFVLAVIMGSLYGVNMKEQNETLLGVLNQYLLVDTKSVFQIDTVLNSVYGYFKQLVIIWLLGFFSFTIPFSLGAFFIMTFSYAFTTTCIILIYGFRGVMIAICTYGLQAMLIIGIAMYLGISSLRQKNAKVSQLINREALGIVPIVIGSCMLALLDVFTMTNIHYIINKLL